MAHFDRGIVGDDGFLMQVGTLSGNPVASVAGLATLAVLRRPGAYEQVFASGRTLMEGIGAMLKKAGLPAQVVGEPPLFDVVFSAEGSTRLPQHAARRRLRCRSISTPSCGRPAS